jgi:PAS domain S-box-containing protein
VSELLILSLNAGINCLVGILVYLTNPSRGQNRAFLLLTLVLGCWNLAVIGAILSDSPSQGMLMIRLATLSTAFVPAVFHILCLAITHPDAPSATVLKKARGTLLACLAVGLISFTSFYMSGATLAHSEFGMRPLPQPIYGPGFPLFCLIHLAISIRIIVIFVRAFRDATGSRKNELQFVLLGVAVMTLSGLFIALALPRIFGTTDVQQFGPLSSTGMNCIIAYGIATRRIMDVANVLRTATAYMLLAVYLVGVYALTWYVITFINRYTVQTPLPLANLVAALAVAYSMAPANGMLQRFANRLFINMTRVNVSTTLQQASDLLYSISTMNELMGKFGTFISEAIGTDQVYLFMKTGDYYTLTYPEELETKDAVIRGNSPIAQYFEQTDKPLCLDTLKRHRESPKRRAIMLHMRAYSAEQAVAIRSKTDATGIMLLGRKLSGRVYNAEETDAMQILGRHLGTAIDNAELYTETQNGKIYNEMLLDNMVGGVVAVSTGRQITVFNAEAQRILGKKHHEMIGSPISVLPEKIASLLDETLTRKEGVRDQDYFLPADANEDEVPIRVSSAMFHGHDDTELGAMLIINDLTAIRKLEEQLLLSDRLACIGTLSAGMAHEIKNPLVAIKTFAQLLPERYQDEDFRDTFSQIINDEITRIDSIVNQLLSFARPTKPALEAMSLCQVLDKTTTLVQQQLKTFSVSLKLQLHANEDQILGDKDQLEQVFLNFILNAIDSMKDGGILTLRTESLQETTHWRGVYETKGKIRVSISDTGHGISKENIPHVFDPFFTTKSQGTGLGLAVAHSIIEEHHATVVTESELDVGTTFHITFPLVMQEAPA